MGMLEVIESDFARLEADTKAAEASAQKEYDTFMTDSKADVAAKNGHRAQDGEEAGPRGHPEGIGCRLGLFRQAEAILRGLGCELRGPRCPQEGGDRVPPGGAQDPQRGGHCLRDAGWSPCLPRVASLRK